MLRIDPTTGLTIDGEGRGLRGALLAVALGSGLGLSTLLGWGLLHRMATFDEGDALPDAVELREPARFLAPARAELPPCPALRRCPYLRAHPEALLVE